MTTIKEFIDNVADVAGKVARPVALGVGLTIAGAGVAEASGYCGGEYIASGRDVADTRSQMERSSKLDRMPVGTRCCIEYHDAPYLTYYYRKAGEATRSGLFGNYTISTLTQTNRANGQRGQCKMWSMGMRNGD